MYVMSDLGGDMCTYLAFTSMSNVKSQIKMYMQNFIHMMASNVILIIYAFIYDKL